MRKSSAPLWKMTLALRRNGVACGRSATSAPRCPACGRANAGRPAWCAARRTASATELGPDLVSDSVDGWTRSSRTCGPCDDGQAGLIGLRCAGTDIEHLAARQRRQPPAGKVAGQRDLACLAPETRSTARCANRPSRVKSTAARSASVREGRLADDAGLGGQEGDEILAVADEARRMGHQVLGGRGSAACRDSGRDAAGSPTASAPGRCRPAPGR